MPKPLRLQQLLFLILISALSWTPTVSAADSAPLVLVSVRPFYSWVDQLVKETPVQVDVLVPQHRSPHHYALSPAKRKQLAVAETVIWVGPEFEGFLANAAQGSQNWLRLDHLKDFNYRPIRCHHHHHGHDHGHESHHHGHDPHLWLAIDQAPTLIQAMADHLSEVFPNEANQIRANRDQLLANMSQKTLMWQSQLSGANLSWYVMHDAFGYLGDALSLPEAGAFHLVPGVPLTPQRFQKLTQQLKAHPGCVFADPESQDDNLMKQLTPHALMTGTLDVLGSHLALDETHYFKLIDTLVAQLVQCHAMTEANHSNNPAH